MSHIRAILLFFFFFFNDTATTEIYTLSLHDALPISPVGSDLLPAGREPGQAGLLPGGVDGAAIILGLLLEILRIAQLAQLAGGIRHTQQPAQIPHIIADDVMFAVPEKLTVGDGVGQ